MIDDKPKPLNLINDLDEFLGKRIRKPKSQVLSTSPINPKKIDDLDKFLERRLKKGRKR